MEEKKLYRASIDKKICGVCGGIALKHPSEVLAVGDVVKVVVLEVDEKRKRISLSIRDVPKEQR